MVLFLSLALVLGVWSSQSFAQMLPENHYLVYEVPQTYLFTGDIVLGDRFGAFATPEVLFDKFATPVSKNGELIFELVVHQTWWTIFDPQSIWWTTIVNQFGMWDMMLLEPCWLCLPTVKLQAVPNEPHTWGKIKSMYSD